MSHGENGRETRQHQPELYPGQATRLGAVASGVDADGAVAARENRGMEVLSSRILLRPTDPDQSRSFYRDTLGLAIYREFGPPDAPGIVFFLGHGFLEISGQSSEAPGPGFAIWLQVRDVRAEHERLRTAGVTIAREPRIEPWGLRELWIEDPDGVRIVLVEVPDDHPLRRDPR
jgi:catechol 2,3-dioxygenase-like lactoylglutathione lyase family enzyme